MSKFKKRSQTGRYTDATSGVADHSINSEPDWFECKSLNKKRFLKKTRERSEEFFDALSSEGIVHAREERHQSSIWIASMLGMVSLAVASQLWYGDSVEGMLSLVTWWVSVATFIANYLPNQHELLQSWVMVSLLWKIGVIVFLAELVAQWLYTPLGISLLTIVIGCLIASVTTVPWYVVINMVRLLLVYTIILALHVCRTVKDFFFQRALAVVMLVALYTSPELFAVTALFSILQPMVFSLWESADATVAVALARATWEHKPLLVCWCFCFMYWIMGATTWEVFLFPVLLNLLMVNNVTCTTGLQPGSSIVMGSCRNATVVLAGDGDSPIVRTKRTNNSEAVELLVTIFLLLCTASVWMHFMPGLCYMQLFPRFTYLGLHPSAAIVAEHSASLRGALVTITDRGIHIGSGSYVNASNLLGLLRSMPNVSVGSVGMQHLVHSLLTVSVFATVTTWWYAHAYKYRTRCYYRLMQSPEELGPVVSRRRLQAHMLYRYHWSTKIQHGRNVYWHVLHASNTNWGWTGRPTAAMNNSDFIGYGLPDPTLDTCGVALPGIHKAERVCKRWWVTVEKGRTIDFDQEKFSQDRLINLDSKISPNMRCALPTDKLPLPQPINAALVGWIIWCVSGLFFPAKIMALMLVIAFWAVRYQCIHKHFGVMFRAGATLLIPAILHVIYSSRIVLTQYCLIAAVPSTIHYLARLRPRQFEVKFVYSARWFEPGGHFFIQNYNSIIKRLESQCTKWGVACSRLSALDHDRPVTLDINDFQACQRDALVKVQVEQELRMGNVVVGPPITGLSHPQYVEIAAPRIISSCRGVGSVIFSFAKQSFCECKRMHSQSLTPCLDAKHLLHIIGLNILRSFLNVELWVYLVRQSICKIAVVTIRIYLIIWPLMSQFLSGAGLPGLLMGSGNTTFWGFFALQLFHLHERMSTKRQLEFTFRTLWKRAWHGLWYCNPSPLLAGLADRFGLVPALILLGQEKDRLDSRALQALVSLSGMLTCSQVLDPSKITIFALQFSNYDPGIGNHWVIGLPEKGEYFGVNPKDGKVRVLDDSFDRVNGSFFFQLDIGRDEWLDVKADFMQHTGSRYTPFNNCQSTILKTLHRTYHAPSSLIVMAAVAGFLQWWLSACCVLAGIIGVKKEFSESLQTMLFSMGGGTGNPLHMLLFPFTTTVDEIKKRPETFEKFGLDFRFFKQGIRSWYIAPAKGAWRAEYSMFRAGDAPNPHKTTPDLEATQDERAEPMMKTICSQLPEGLCGSVAVVATTGKRPLQSSRVERLSQLFDHVIVLTDKPRKQIGKEHIIVIDVPGRHLACARVMMPEVKGVTWISINSAQRWHWIEEILAANYQNLLHHHEFAYAAAGLQQANAGGLVYTKGIPYAEMPCMDVYGSDEVAFIKRKGLGLCMDGIGFYMNVPSCMDFMTNRDLVLYKKNMAGTYVPTRTGHVKRWEFWSLCVALDCFQPCVVDKPWVVGPGLIHIGSKTVNLMPIAGLLAGANQGVPKILKLFKTNVNVVLKRVEAITDLFERRIAEGNVSDAALYRACSNMLTGFGEVSRPFKAAWAPVPPVVKAVRVPETRYVLHSNPKYVSAGIDETLQAMMKSFKDVATDPRTNRDRALKFQIDWASQEKHVLRRRVNTNPLIDAWLPKQLEDSLRDNTLWDATITKLDQDAAMREKYGEFRKYKDSIALATRETVIAATARYCGKTIACQGLEADAYKIAAKMVDHSPELYLDAKMSDPSRLANRFLSRKHYSIGMPFEGLPMQDGPPLKTRHTFKRAGLRDAMVKAAMEAPRTGVYMPSVAHVIPKSEIKPIEKFVDPRNMRTLTAVSPINNLQQGVFFFYSNSIHDPLNSSSQVGLPNTGRYFNALFSSMDRFKYKYSFDFVKWDANQNPALFEVLRHIRYLGFEGHPAKETIRKHIDCLIQQTQESYLVNLVDKSFIATMAQATPELKEVWETVDPSLLQECFNEAERHFASSFCPGGVVHKEHGGEQGSINTSYYNTIACQAALMYVIVKTHKAITYHNYYDMVDIVNLGDDNVTGSMIPLDTVEMQAFCERELGMKLKIESSDTTTLGQTFLGKIPHEGHRYAADFELIDMEVPKYAILHDPKRLAAKFANYKTESTRHFKNPINRELWKIVHGIGYMQLTAHSPEMYEAFKAYVVEADKELKRTNAGRAIASKYKNMMRIPSYYKVLKQWYEVKKIETPTYSTKLMYETSIAATSENLAAQLLQRLSAICNTIPDCLMLKTQDEFIAEEVCDTTGIVESHVFYTLATKLKRAPTVDEVERGCSAGPFAAICNTHNWYALQGIGLPIVGEQAELNADYAAARMTLFLIVYTSMGHSIKWLRTIPGGNLFVSLLNLHNHDLRRLFTAAGLVYWLATSTVSSTISSLLPRDPYASQKEIASQVASICPDTLLLMMPTLRPLMRAAALVGESLAGIAISTTIPATPLPSAILDAPRPDEWEKVAATVMASSERILTVVAHTGTGKTRYLPFSIRHLSPSARIIIAEPRRILCQAVQDNGIPWKTATNDPQENMITCTWGHLAVALENDAPWLRDDDIILLDEGHEPDTDKLSVLALARNRVIILTATPAGLSYPTVECGLPPRFPVEHRRCKVTMPNNGKYVLDVIPHVIEEGKRNIMVIHPSKTWCKTQAAKYNAQSIRGRLITSKILSAEDRDLLPESPNVNVLFATSVAEAGITWKGCDAVIDSNLSVVNEGGHVHTTISYQSVGVQRAGRTGRTCAGTYYDFYDLPSDIPSPAPSLSAVLEGSRQSVHRCNNGVGITVNLAVNAGRKNPLAANKYGFLPDTTPMHQIQALSFLHMLELDSHSTVRDLYNKAVMGRADPELMQYWKLLGFDIASYPEYKTVLAWRKQSPVLYADDCESSIVTCAKPLFSRFTVSLGPH